MIRIKLSRKHLNAVKHKKIEYLARGLSRSETAKLADVCESTVGNVVRLYKKAM